MTNPRISILMLTYNRPLKISRAIESVLEQTFSSWELIVVQDGENRAAEAAVSAFAARDPRIRYFRRGVVGSIAEASNFGLDRATGDYIAILDDDDCWSDPEKLARQVEFLDMHPDYVACGGGYTVVDEDGGQRGVFYKPLSDRDIRAHALLANPIANSTAVFRRIAGGAPARYDEALRGYADWDFWLALGDHGKLYNFPIVLAHYTLWHGGGSFRQHRVNARAGIHIVVKHRRAYRRFPLAWAFAWTQYAYACLPEGLRRASYQTLSSLKKSLAASRRAETVVPAERSRAQAAD